MVAGKNHFFSAVFVSQVMRTDLMGLMYESLFLCKKGQFVIKLMMYSYIFLGV